MSKTPQRVNNGGLWLMNPQAPQSITTNITGLSDLTARTNTELSLTNHRAGWASVIPPGWLIDVPGTAKILTGAEPEVTAAGTEFEGEHILRMQPVFASENVPGSVGHPRYLTGTQLGTVVESGPVAHVAWYDSIKYAERVQDSNTELSTIRNYYWSLYYGDYPLNIGPSVATYPGWWLVAFFNPGTEPFDGNVGRWEFWSEWAFSHPLEDAGLTPAASGPGVADHANQRSESAQVRFNPLGANVFRRVGTNGILQESITARPFYG